MDLQTVLLQYGFCFIMKQVTHSAAESSEKWHHPHPQLPSPVCATRYSVTKRADEATFPVKINTPDSSVLGGSRLKRGESKSPPQREGAWLETLPACTAQGTEATALSIHTHFPPAAAN